MIPTVAEPPAVSRSSAAASRFPPTIGPGDNDVEARSTYNAVFVSANHRLSQRHPVRRLVHLQQLDEQQRRVARRRRHRRARASVRRTCSTTSRSGAGRSSIGRTASRVSYLWEIPGPTSGILGADPRRLADLGRHAGAVGPPVHDLHRRRLERRREHRFGPSEHQPRRQLRVGREPSQLHQQRLSTWCRSGTNGLPLAHSLGTATRRATASARPGSGIPTWRCSSASTCSALAPDGPRRRVQRAQSGQLRHSDQLQ